VRSIGWLALLFGCGRLGFDATSGGPDALAGDAVALTSPCVTAHAFCDDFDAAGGLGALWDAVQIDPTPTAQLALDTTLAQSMPASLLTTMTRATGANKYGALVRRIGGPWTHARFDVDLYIEAPTWQLGDGQVGLIVVLLRSWTTSAHTMFATSQATSLALWTNDTAQAYHPLVGYEETRGNFMYPPAPELPFDRWVHVAIDIQLAGTVRFEIDGASVTRSFPPITSQIDPFASLSIGRMDWDTATDTSGGFRVWFDNVVLDLD
jgi:hypothetical protein